LDDYSRARAIYELAISQPELDMPELVWKSYIDFEEEEEEWERTRLLYERLLEKTEHVKVWISYAHFEINVPDEDVQPGEEDAVSEEAKERARRIFEKGYRRLKDKGLKEERVVLLNAWKSFEQTHGTAQTIQNVEAQMPRKVKKRRKLDDDSFEEYMDYLFPADEEQNAGVLKLLQAAHKWKQEQQANTA